MSGSVFDPVADAYDAGRPSYPQALFRRLEELAGRPLADALVLDVGAGTGISARGMIARGARVLALDLGPGMLRRLRARSPAPPAMVADGNDLPIRDGAVDFVTYAQSWHWLDPVLSVAEARRVLRMGGAMAAWWNVPDFATGWLSDHNARVQAACSDYEGCRHGHPVAEAAEAGGLRARGDRVTWTRRVPVETFLTDLRSHSYVAALEPAAVEALIARERAELTAEFPAGELTMPMVVELTVGRLR